MWKNKRLFWASFILIALLRSYLLARLPVNTTDISRHLIYGFYFSTGHWEVLGLSLKQINEAFSGITWSHLPFNYPLYAAVPFTLAQFLGGSIFAAKLLLTLCELFSSFLIYKLSGSRLMALIYWALPVSIWYVSGEAQFEPWQNLFILLSMFFLRRNIYLAIAAFIVAVQIKLFALALLPLILFEIYSKRRETNFISLATILLALILPGLLAEQQYSSWQNVFSYSQALDFNPWHFYPSFWSYPKFISLTEVVWYQLFSALLLFYLAALFIKSTQKAIWLAPLIFLLFLKFSPNAQPWYLLTFAALLPYNRDSEHSLKLLVLIFLAEPFGLSQLIFGNWLYNIHGYFGPLDVFSPWRL